MDKLDEVARIPSTGDEVQRRYRYQYLYTALLAIRMYKKEIPYEELYCELAEDVLTCFRKEDDCNSNQNYRGQSFYLFR